MNWIKNLLKFGFGVALTLFVVPYIRRDCPEQARKVSLYNPIDTMRCTFIRYEGNKAVIRNGYMVFVCVDSSNTKAFVVDSSFNEVDCNTLIEIDVKP